MNRATAEISQTEIGKTSTSMKRRRDAREFDEDTRIINVNRCS